MKLTALDMTGEAWHHYAAEIPLFHQVAADCGPEAVIINIGVCFGTSMLAFHEGNPTAMIYGIDIEPCDGAHRCWINAGADTSRLVRIRGRSQEMRWDRQVDAVLIDGAHDRASIEQDVATWMPRTRKWLVFHDYYNPVCPNVGPDVDGIMAPRKPDIVAGFLAAYRMDDKRDAVVG